MRAPFVHDVPAARVVFGAGAIGQVGPEVDRLGASRVLLVASGRHAAALEAELGDRIVGRFAEVVMHVPVETAQRAAAEARAVGADLVVAVGGGSATGTAKAVARETGLPILAVPTTYAGSEMTPIWGLTEDGRKTTGRDLVVLPRTVVYDPELTVSMPAALSAASGMNALAHLVEGLYAPSVSPLLAAQAEEGVRALASALPRVVADPADLGARSDALYGAWLAGWILGTCGMGVHHKVCHTLGGTYDLPHAPAHSAVLAYAAQFNQDHAPDAMAAIVRAFRAAGRDADDAPSAVWQLAVDLGAPVSLEPLGFAASSIDEAAGIVVAARPVNPRPVDVDGVRALLAAAYAGARPEAGSDDHVPPRTRTSTSTKEGSMAHMTEEEITAEVVRRLEATAGPRLREVMQSLVRHLHAFAREVRLTDEEWFTGIRFLTDTGHITDATRQEFILLSDTLGLSTLVDTINHSDVESLATEPTILGPFYVAESPWRERGASMVEYDDGGEPAILTGRVVDPDGAPIAGAVLDVWQNSATGFYAVQQPDEQPPTNLRGRYLADADGSYEIRTVRPVPYPIPDDGPVGRLLRDTGRHPWRAAHIHAKVTADGFAPVTTHIFDRRSDYLDSDTVFGVKESLIEDFVPGPDGVLVCRHDVVLDRL